MATSIAVVAQLAITWAKKSSPFAHAKHSLVLLPIRRLLALWALVSLALFDRVSDGWVEA